MPVSTCEASGLSAAQAEPAETATSRSAKRRLSPSTPGNVTFKTWAARRAGVAVLPHARRSRASSCHSAIAQRREPRRLARRVGELVGLAHADDLMRRQRAGTQAALLLAAVQLRHERRARRDVQRADALRAAELVRRQRAEVDRRGGKVERQLADALRGVDVEQHAARAARRADRLRRLG